MIIQRELHSDQIRLLQEGKDITISETDPFFNQFPSHDVIRIWSEEYSEIPEAGNLFTHFNLQVSHHKIGSVYLLPKIIGPGHFDGKNEILPLLSFEHIPYGICVEVQEEMQYEDLTEKDFEHSFSHIKTVEELQEAIVRRYSRSLPHLSKEEILNAGVSKTTLKILGRV